ncbi:helix-turn-helix transcriptional regulator [Calidifontibacter indicus]|uniref:helix-turn-helix transcriptional regulator n=1 Tax=Calidifontibacter indicus TaxID=419650 RepID=UPI000E233D9A|nr:metalloregulator ArsR/SmtB family transcription factor [Calidifontibacter indicus]
MFIADRAVPAADRAESGTRRRVLTLVSERGPITAAQVAEILGLTTAGVRRHLDVLAEEGAVAESEHTLAEARKRGRPARAYVLTDQGHKNLRGDYDELATSVLRFLRDTQGEDAVGAFAKAQATALAERVRAAVEAAGDDPEARSAALADALRDEGYAASARPVGKGTPLAGVQLCQGHCPVQHVAAEFPQFCEAEAEAFSGLLGVHVQRLASLAHGDHVCTTFVPTHQLAHTSHERRDPR